MGPPSYTNGQLCLTNVTGYNGTFSWTIPGVNGGLSFSDGLCQTVGPNTPVWVNGPNNVCSLGPNYYPCTASGGSCGGGGGGGGTPPFSKTVVAYVNNAPYGNQTSGTSPLILQQGQNGINGEQVQYTLRFIPPSGNTNATITDTIGTQGGKIPGTTNTSTNYGEIDYDKDMVVRGTAGLCGSRIPALNTDCYSGDIGSSGGITFTGISGAVTITYTGTVHNSNLSIDCNSDSSSICYEKFVNYANASVNGSPLPTVSTLVESFCQYILTRASGDIYLETDLNYGKDISACSQYKNTTGLILTPGAPPQQTTPSTGTSGTVSVGHEICNGANFTVNLNGAKQPEILYGSQVVKNLSSEICEVRLRPGQDWGKSEIASSIEENKTRIARWAPNLPSNTTIRSLNDLPASSTGVYHMVGGDLTIDPSHGDPGSTTNNFISDGDGAKTFIVENGNLIIKSNINYGPCASGKTCTVRDTASLAFIVLNGNIEIAPDVTQISGVFFVQQGKDAKGILEDNGKLISIGDASSYKELQVFGSIYGNIQDLLNSRKFSGDPASNGGSIVIRFDERIILNTPPGLQDLLQLNENQVAE
jgi:hypothetical protein